MSASAFDPVQYKTEQREGWALVAAGWGKWWDTFERGGQALSDRLVDGAGIQPGQRVLDVATGIGEPAVTAARRVGPRGRVVAIDLAPAMLAIARDRAAALGLENLDSRAMDAEAPDLPEETFDAILCRWALMFLPDPEAALARLRRLLRPGGRLAAGVWGPASEVPLISLRMDVAARVLGVPPPSPGAPQPFALADSRRLEQMLAGAGFTEVRSERMTLSFEFPSAESFIRFEQDVAGPRVPTLADQPPERQAAFWQALTEAVRPYAAADGGVRLPNQAIWVVGRR